MRRSLDINEMTVEDTKNALNRATEYKRLMQEAVVSKGDLDTYRKNVGNKNATLGQYMNDLQNKTARVGGKNDPAVIQKSLKSGQKAFDPTTTTGKFGGPKSSGSSTTSSANAPKPKNLEPSKPVTQPDQNATKQVPTVKTPEEPTKSPPSGAPSGAAAGSAGASISGGVGGAGGVAGSGPGAGSGGDGGAGIAGGRGGKGGKGGDTLNECVEINGNRYRIV